MKKTEEELEAEKQITETVKNIIDGIVEKWATMMPEYKKQFSLDLRQDGGFFLGVYVGLHFPELKFSEQKNLLNIAGEVFGKRKLNKEDVFKLLHSLDRIKYSKSAKIMEYMTVKINYSVLDGFILAGYIKKNPKQWNLELTIDTMKYHGDNLFGVVIGIQQARQNYRTGVQCGEYK